MGRALAHSTLKLALSLAVLVGLCTVQVRISYYLSLAGIACAGAYLLLADAVGCAADLKSGLGDTARALQLEDWSLLPLVLFVPVSVAAVGTHPRIPKVVALVWLIVCLPLLCWCGIETEVAAVVRCGSGRIQARTP